MKTLTIGTITLKNRYIMAPLAGYTNKSLRKMALRNGASLAYTEMISCNALLYKNKKTFDMLPKEDEGGRIALQLFGGDIEVISKAIKIVEENAKFDFLDFNMGCPVLKVMKQFSGSYWLKRQDELKKLFHTLVSNSRHPVLIKTRIGYDENHKNVLDVIKIAAEEGVAGVAIHGRTKTQLYGGNVNYDIINEAKKMNLLPIIANGNISLNNISEVEKITNADGYMFGREALGHPTIFSNLILKEKGYPIIDDNIEQQTNFLIEHFNNLKKEFGIDTAISLIRGVGPFYFKGLQDASIYKSSIIKISSEKDFFDLMNQIKKLNK